MTLPYKTLICALLFSSMIWGQINVLTFNIRYDNPEDGVNRWDDRKEEVVAMLRYYQPTIFGLQEALNHQREYLQHQLAGYASIGFGRDGEGTLSEATPIFYRREAVELIDSKTFWLSPTPNEVSKGWDAALNRICTYGMFRMKATGEILHVFNAHFDHVGSLARENSARLILKKIIELNLPNQKVIVMGDFNCEPNETPYEVLREMLEDALSQDLGQTYGPSGTWNAFETSTPITKRIDYILTKNLMITSYRHVDDRRKSNFQLSDHLPVMVGIAF